MAKRVCLKDVDVIRDNLDKAIEVQISSSILFAFSPIAKVEKMPNGNYLITITDKLGTTTAEVPVINEETISDLIAQYFEDHPIIEQYIAEHDQSDQAHEDIRNLIQQTIELIPTKVSQLENDREYVTNAKQILAMYDTRQDFPVPPSETEQDMIFYDRSTGDMFYYGLQDQTYTSIGLSKEDILDGGNAFS